MWTRGGVAYVLPMGADFDLEARALLTVSNAMHFRDLWQNDTRPVIIVPTIMRRLGATHNASQEH